MGGRFQFAAVMLAAILGLPRSLWAGMPSVGFSELAGMRLEGISFFAVVLLLSAAAIWFLWNRLAKDFEWLPRLSYLRACGVVVLWGLLFVIVLTMISGARELMTPGAWVRNGATYQLAEEETPPVAQPAAENAPSQQDQLALRRLQLAELRHQLQQYAEHHGGRFPASIADSGIEDQHWRLPDVSGLRYVYVAGRTTGDAGLPLAFEPQLYDGDPLVLLVGGEIVPLPRERIEQSLAMHAPGP